MNNLYQWHDDWMSELEMRQVRQEMENVRMLKEAGVIGNGWLASVGRALVHFIAVGWKKILSLRSVEHPTQQAGSSKLL